MCEHGTKTTPVFLPADGEASWSLLPSSVSLLSGGTVQPENTYSCILKVTDQVWESQKRISINTNHSYHQRSYPQASLSWSNNKARFSFNQPNKKRWGAQLVYFFDEEHISVINKVMHSAELNYFMKVINKYEKGVVELTPLEHHT